MQGSVIAQRIYAVESWALIALGLLHAISTFRLFSTYTTQAHWFLAAGVLMVAVGVLNLLNGAYGRGAAGLRFVCIGANVVISIYSVAGGIQSRASLVAWILVLGIVVPLTVLSCSRVVHR